VPRIKTTEVKQLGRLGVRTVRDLLLYLPRDLERFTDAEQTTDGKVSFVGTVVPIRRKRSPVKGMLLTEAVVADDEGATLRVAWFKNPYVAQHLHAATGSRWPGECGRPASAGG
jgi:ATP-dependent DNA helicase RecG